LPLVKGNKGVYELFQLPGELKDADDEHAIPLVDSGHLYIKSYDVAPDGKKIVVSATPTPNFDDFFDQEIYLVDIGTKEQSKLDVNPLHVERSCFPTTVRNCVIGVLKQSRAFLIIRQWKLITWKRSKQLFWLPILMKMFSLCAGRKRGF